MWLQVHAPEAHVEQCVGRWNIRTAPQMILVRTCKRLVRGEPEGYLGERKREPHHTFHRSTYVPWKPAGKYYKDGTSRTPSLPLRAEEPYPMPDQLCGNKRAIPGCTEQAVSRGIASQARLGRAARCRFVNCLEPWCR